MAAVAACGGSVLVKNVIPRHLECITAKLREMSVEVTEFDDAVLVRREGKLTKTNIKTPVPGLPDRHAAADDDGAVSGRGHQHHHRGGIWGSRYRYTEELTRMGAAFMWMARSRLLEGVRELNGAPVRAHDLRAGAAMVIAGLAAKGVTEVEQVQNIERGYETLVEVCCSGCGYVSLRDFRKAPRTSNLIVMRKKRRRNILSPFLQNIRQMSGMKAECMVRRASDADMDAVLAFCRADFRGRAGYSEGAELHPGG